jgi:fructoselysine-6-P-deglycase FrlB-like protein
MGRPYSAEMQELPATYACASGINVEPLVDFLGSSVGAPLLAVGSGGSLTAASLAALLHQRRGGVAKALTPMELAYAERAIPESNVLLISAGGRNVDVLAAFEVAAMREPRQLFALTARSRSPLAEIAERYRYTQHLALELPTGKDGFLATNSLMAFLIALLRADARLSGSTLAPDLPDHSQSVRDATLASGILARDTYIVLHGGWGGPAAVDLESKLTEAALAHVQLADYRNFGHGRHHWLAKRGESAAVIALVTPAERDIARRTLKLLPSTVPVLELSTDDATPAAALDLVVQVFHLTGEVGRTRGIDPGRPGVPSFGSKLYNLKPSRPKPAQPNGIPADTAVAIRRKTAPLEPDALGGDELARWTAAHGAFVRGIRAAEFGAVVLDYDGTLCEPWEKKTGPGPQVRERLLALLEGGITIGIATGRGKSVRTDLQRLIPEGLWRQILVGYYNGSDIALLSDDERPLTSPIDPTLGPVAEWISANPSLAQLAKHEIRPRQISVEPVRASAWAQAKLALAEGLRRSGAPGVRIVESSHSIDIIAPGVTKVAVAEACLAGAGDREVLCIGDRGRWPGNDYDLLSGPHSLSVDTVSPDPGSCWNLCPPGHRGVQGTLDYLGRLRIDSGFATFH